MCPSVSFVSIKTTELILPLARLFRMGYLRRYCLMNLIIERYIRPREIALSLKEDNNFFGFNQLFRNRK